MALFLFLKQLVDALYQFKILDYGMVIFAIILLLYLFWKEKMYVQLPHCLVMADYLVVCLGAVYLLSFLRYPSAYSQFVKVESCLLIYFLGRVYGSRIMSYGKYLAVAGYLILYVNLVYRFYQWDYRLFVSAEESKLLNLGGLYYYKTDLGVGVVIAVLFIYMFSKATVLKWISILPIAAYMVFYSNARMGQVVLILEYLLILLYELKQRGKVSFSLTGKHNKGICVAVLAFAVLFFVMLQVFPFEQVAAALHIETGKGSLLEKVFHSRHIIWWDILSYFSDQPILTRLFGIDLETEYLHTSKSMRAHSAYIKQIYATGYVGCLLMVTFILQLYRRLCLEKDQKLRYIVIILWLMLMISGLTIESLESTQMSWFPMLFAGVLVTDTAARNKESIVE